MGVAVQRQAVLRPQHAGEVQRIMHRDDAPAAPFGLERRVLKVEAERGDGPLQGLAFLVVVAENAVEGRGQAAKHLQRLGLGDVASVEHGVHTGLVHQLDDAPAVLEVVVGVADDADAHDGPRTTVRCHEGGEASAAAGCGPGGGSSSSSAG